MKKINITITTAFIIMCTALTSCASTDQPASDTYTNQESSKNTAIEKNTDKIKQTGISSLFIANEDPKDRIGTGTLSVDNLLSTKIIQKPIDFSYDRSTGNEKVFFSAKSGLYNMELNTSARKRIRKAVSFYHSDFANHVLSKKNSKSYKNYGEIPVTMHWGSVSAMMYNHAITDMDVGYKFKNGAPYFTFTFWETKNEAYTEGISKVEAMPNFTLYLTKSQSQNFADMLDEQVLAKIQEQKISTTEPQDQY